MTDLEQRLARSLRELTDALPVRVRAAPPSPSAAARRWRPAWVAALAAAAVLIVGAVVWRVAVREPERGMPVDTMVAVPTTQPAIPTVAPGPVESLPRAPSPRWMLADPTMATLSAVLAKSGVTAETVATADLTSEVPRVRTLVADDLIGPVVIVHVGTDGPLPAGALDAVLDELRAIPQVVLVTDHGQAAWTAPNNTEIAAAVRADRPNVSLFDWATVASMCPDTCVADDGVTLTEDGTWFYAEQLAAFVGFSLPHRPASAATLPILAVTDDGDAVMIPAGQETPVVLYDLPADSPNRVTAIAVTDDDRAFVGTCCLPLSGEAFEVHPSALDQPPTHAAFASVVDFGDDDRGLVSAIPEGFRAGMGLGGDGMAIAIPGEVGTLIDVAWLDGLPKPIPAPFTYGQGQVAALARAADGIHLVTAADVARTSRLDHHAVINDDAAADLRLAGTTHDGLVLVFDRAQPTIVTAYDPATLAAVRQVELSGAARSVWMQGDAIVWIDDAGTLRDGERVLPGVYDWARR